jgi:hypothetical protein
MKRFSFEFRWWLASVFILWTWSLMQREMSPEGIEAFKQFVIEARKIKIEDQHIETSK